MVSIALVTTQSGQHWQVSIDEVPALLVPKKTSWNPLSLVSGERHNAIVGITTPSGLEVAAEVRFVRFPLRSPILTITRVASGQSATYSQEDVLSSSGRAGQDTSCLPNKTTNQQHSLPAGLFEKKSVTYHHCEPYLLFQRRYRSLNFKWHEVCTGFHRQIVSARCARFATCTLAIWASQSYVYRELTERVIIVIVNWLVGTLKHAATPFAKLWGDDLRPVQKTGRGSLCRFHSTTQRRRRPAK